MSHVAALRALIAPGADGRRTFACVPDAGGDCDTRLQEPNRSEMAAKMVVVGETEAVASMQGA